MNESKTGLFRSFWYSITSFSKYRLFLKQSAGRVVAYLLLLSVLSTLGTCIEVYSIVNQTGDEIIARVREEFPDFRLENGQLEVYAEMPIIIDGSPPVVIDTRPGIDAEDILYQYDNAILITRDKYIVKSYLRRQELSWSMVNFGGPMTRGNFAEIVENFRMILNIVLVIASVIIFIIIIAGNFINALIVSVLGAIFNAARGTGLSYRNILKISIYSMTLPLTVGAVLKMFRISVPFWYVFFLAVCSVYILGAINVIKAGLNAMYENPGGFSGFGDQGGPGTGSWSSHGNHGDYVSPGVHGGTGAYSKDAPGSGDPDGGDGSSGQDDPGLGSSGTGQDDPAPETSPRQDDPGSGDITYGQDDPGSGHIGPGQDSHDGSDDSSTSDG